MLRINKTGDCFETFLATLDLEPTARQELAATAQKAIARAVETYERVFGSGEVGAAGTGLVGASKKVPGIPVGTTGLLYGKVQSGKTNATIATTALAFENGFRTVVVLTSDNTLLGRQTFKRFRDGLASYGPRVHDWEDWRRDPEAFGRQLRADGIIEDTGILLLTTKNVANLKGLDQALRAADAGRFPGLVIDDEADNASLNTFAAANERSGTNKASGVFDQIGRIRRHLPHHLYLQVTATPQSLLLQAVDHPCRPAFCVAIAPGSEYTGGDVFFGRSEQQATTLCVQIDQNEGALLRGSRVQTGRNADLPDGLRTALCTFFLAAAFKHQSRERPRAEPYTILIHVSHRQVDHSYVAHLVTNFVTRLDKAVRGKASPSEQKQADAWLQKAWTELQRTATDLPPLSELKKHLARTLTNAIPAVVNADMADSEVDYRPGVNILIGGNRLGRGLTIPGLIVTYYTRDPRVTMSDTVHQHARMFGYRSGLIEVARLFSTPQLIRTFTAIHDADEGMRDVIGADPTKLRVRPVWVGNGLRPTRANVLNPAEIGAVRSGIAIFPPDPLWRRSDVESSTKKLDKLLEKFEDGVFHDVPLSVLKTVLSQMPSRPMDGYTWEDRRVQEILDALAHPDLNIAGGILDVHRGRAAAGLQLTRQPAPFQGFAAGDWITDAKRAHPQRPTLIVMMQEGSRRLGWDNQRLYVPTLVLPDTRFVFMFNYTDPKN